MDTLILIHQGVLFSHLVAFAVSISTVLREDLAVLRTLRIDLARLSAAARTLSLSLAALWASGCTLLVFDVGLDPGALLTHPKALAKLLVVAALTANGLALHTLAFPMLRGAEPALRGTLVVPLVLGAISTASWLYAAFLGVSRLIAPAMTLPDFMTLYGVLLACSVGGAFVFVRPRIAPAFRQPG